MSATRTIARIDPRATDARGGARGGAALLALLLPLLASCSALGFGEKKEIAPALAAQYHASAIGALEAGRPRQAIEDLADLWETPNLDPDLRLKIDADLERCTDVLVAELEKPGADPDDAEDLWDLSLPRRLRVRFGLAEARLLLAEGERIDAFRTVRSIDTEYPTHEQRAATGAIVAEAGFSLAQDDGTYFFFFEYRERATEPLEYLVLQYPSDPRCAEAYWTLARIYEEEDELELAIERSEDLVVYHSDCPWAAQAALDVARLRMARQERTDYDRGTLVKTRTQVDAWIEAHPGHELAAHAEELRQELRRREAESDLGIASFYEEIEEPYGARLHAERAAATARNAGDESREQRAAEILEWASAADREEAAELLDRLPTEPTPPRPPPPASAPAADESGSTPAPPAQEPATPPKARDR